MLNAAASFSSSATNMLGFNIIATTTRMPRSVPQLLLFLGSIGVFTTVWASLRQTLQSARDDELERTQSEAEFREKYDSWVGSDGGGGGGVPIGRGEPQGRVGLGEEGVRGGTTNRGMIGFSSFEMFHAALLVGSKTAFLAGDMVS
ncbi:hypothetical protein BZA05DRAFT_415650 [Tricharina praecox]|uniref:uncharacterized protein n=1 Tax=Tricharina praecox TaxID=43433 RepID=UPI002220782A|nr:uncharacterized protein BZA05DRAFT_415650 [Tricharina praecox]KAI5856934.1 hypothetical protein BZA05DRAFT_415650 [Tricharina praecox]